HMGLHARMMSKFMRRIAAPVQRANAVLVLVNQVRTNLQAYGAPDESTGGRGPKFYASVRIEVRTYPAKQTKEGTEAVGTRVTARVLKNKVASPYKTAEYDIIFGKGIDQMGCVLDAAEACGVLERPKGSSTYTDTVTGERYSGGAKAVKQLLAEDDALRAR